MCIQMHSRLTHSLHTSASYQDDETFSITQYSQPASRYGKTNTAHTVITDNCHPRTRNTRFIKVKWEWNWDHPPQPVTLTNTCAHAFMNRSRNTLVYIQHVYQWCWDLNRQCFTCVLDLWVTDQRGMARGKLWHAHCADPHSCCVQPDWLTSKPAGIRSSFTCMYFLSNCTAQ